MKDMGWNGASDGIVSVAQYVILLDYKPDSGCVNGDQDGKHAPLTGLSPGRRVSNTLPTAFASEVVTMVFRRHEIRMNGDGKCALFSSSSLTNHPAKFSSRAAIGLVSLATPLQCDTCHVWDSPMWQGGLYVEPLHYA